MKNSKNKEKEKLEEVTGSNFIQLDESLTENKESKEFETDKGRFDLNIELNDKNDDIIIEDKNEYNKNNKNQNELKSNKIKIENKFDKKSNVNNDFNNENNFNNSNNKFVNLNKFNKENTNNNNTDFSLSDKNIELNIKNNSFYNSNEKINKNQQQIKSSEKPKNKIDISFNNMVYDTLDEPVFTTIVRILFILNYNNFFTFFTFILLNLLILSYL